MFENLEKKLTVFTPTYNRAYLLPQLYKSLTEQTSKAFTWIIVDDGSTDDTGSLVSGWINEQVIDIVYIKQENGGKMKAHNVGVEHTKTELFVCVDSDDWLVPTSVEMIINEWSKLSQESKSRIAGIIAYRGKNEYEVMETAFPTGCSESGLYQLYEAGFRGETTLIFKTEIIKRYPFPIIEGEKFITEAYIYDQIDWKYSYYLLPVIIIVCEYRNDGLTRNSLKLKFENPCGHTAYHLQCANYKKSVKKKIIHYIRANCFRHKTVEKDIPVKPSNKIFYNLMYPAGLLLFCYKNLRLKYLCKNK